MIHQLPRAGGTVICKCLGAMNDVTLLSEIAPYDGAGARTVLFHKGKAPSISLIPPADSPRGGPAVTTVYHPLYQACYWFRLVRPRELESLHRELDYVGIVELLHRRASERGETLIIRDWLYLDFWAKPYVLEPTFQLSFADALAQRLRIKRVFTVRHPLDMWLSWRDHGSELELDFETFMRGCRRFAELAAGHGFYRYEDFVKQPSQILARICDDLEITYDETYKYRWFNHRLITGDVDPSRGTDKILPLERRTGDEDVLRRARTNPDYQATLSLLGYTITQ
jgi:hypothetical protein